MPIRYCQRLLLALSLILSGCTFTNGVNLPGDAANGGIATLEAGGEGVTVVQTERRQLLADGQQLSLNVGDRLKVADQGQATLRLGELLSLELFESAELDLQTFDDSGPFTDIALRQTGGIGFVEFNLAKTTEHQLTLDTDLATVTSTGGRILLVRERPNLVWVINLGQVTDVVEVTVGEDRQTVSRGTFRQIAAGQPLSEAQSINLEEIETWLEAVRAGDPVPSMGQLLLPPADTVGEMTTLAVLPPTGQPLEFAGDQGLVAVRLHPVGLFGSPTYSLEDCNGDGAQDLSILAGQMLFDFEAVLAKVQALDVTLINRDLSGNGALWALDAVGDEIARQLVEVEEGQTQTLSLRSDRPIDTAILALVDGCVAGFSLTPPTSTGSPAPPREVSPVAPVDDVVVNVLGQPEEPAAAGAASAAGNGRSAAAGQFAAPALAEDALRIDGEISDWDALPGSDGAAWTRFETMTYDDACLNRFPGREALIDLSGQIRFAYDDEALFVAFQVEDDGYVGYNGEGQEFFLGDSPQLSLDLELLSDLDDSERSADDWQIDFHPDPANPRAVLWQLGSLAARDFAEAIVASRFDQANYVLEAMIPWSSLDFRPQPGDRIGLAANINDNDTPGTNRQECIISTAPQRVWNNPTTWGTLLFEGNR